MRLIRWNDAGVSIEKIVAKRENAGHHHLRLFPQCFQKPTSSELFKIWACMLTLSLLMTTQETFVDCVGKDQTAQNIQSDL